MSFVNLPWRRPRLGLAFTERFLLALRLGPSHTAPGGTIGRLRRELPQGMLIPGSVTPNIESVGEVARIASEMIDALSGRRGTLAILLPDLSIVTAVFPPASHRPADEGGEPGERLLSRLAFPPSEARVDFWRGRKGEVLGAAVRGAVVRQYEQIAEAVDCRLSWVDGSSLVRLPVWAEASASERELVGRIQLYRTHYHVAVFHGGELVDIRTRLRSEDDVEAISEEILRLPALSGVPSFRGVVVSGDGAGACARRLGEQGGFTLGSVVTTEEDEETQLAAALDALTRRG
jgi:hypothetical protein